MEGSARNSNLILVIYVISQFFQGWLVYIGHYGLNEVIKGQHKFYKGLLQFIEYLLNHYSFINSISIVLLFLFLLANKRFRFWKDNFHNNKLFRQWTYVVTTLYIATYILFAEDIHTIHFSFYLITTCLTVTILGTFANQFIVTAKKRKDEFFISNFRSKLPDKVQNFSLSVKGYKNLSNSGYVNAANIFRGMVVIGHGGKVKYHKDSKGYYSTVGMKNWWQISMLATTNPERTGYPTQKPLKLLERIIKASSQEGDVVLDPFCGCATTCIASEKLNRQWIGIDVSVKAYELVKERLKKEVANPNHLFQYDKELVFSTTPPKRTDKNGDDFLVKKYVYVISNPKYEGEYKVGIASDYKTRLNNYQTSDPDRGYKIEHTTHPLIQSYRKVHS